jgi:S-adenosylmethionine-diacylglycerol 3-amino-3-carboxypropyl transferase
MSSEVASSKIGSKVFSWVHRNNLVYNTCWEDPAVDREALNVSPADRLLVITSAGCNALDYLLAGCGEVHAVDVNHIQNSLLELKRAGILNLEYKDFNLLFGGGSHPKAGALYHSHLRQSLSDEARRFWDRRLDFFSGRGWRSSFYYRGCAGILAKFLMTHFFAVKDLRKPLENLINAPNLEEQRQIYLGEIRDRIWTSWIDWLMSRDVTMNLMGVPPPQKAHMSRHSSGGVSRYIRDSLESVLTTVPFKSNYFYRVYIEGSYPADCRPEYLKEENFARLRERMSDLHIHTASVSEFLEQTELRFSRFVLLDHMDWMSAHNPTELSREWNAILLQAYSGARVIYRSAAREVSYLHQLPVFFEGYRYSLGELLSQRTEIAEKLHSLDRVHTYASFYIADLPVQ